ncbi:MAG: universal stress protein [Proteobacteria bacterium]|nr:universal stress protein [Pseudomonadota bacterium]
MSDCHVLLAVTTGAGDDEAVVDAAAWLSAAEGAKAHVVPVLVNPALEFVDLAVELGAPVTGQTLRDAERVDLEVQARIRSLVALARARYGLDGRAAGRESLTLHPHRHDRWWTPPAILPLADLTLFGRGGARGPGMLTDAFDAWVLRSGTPTLLVGSEASSLQGGRAAIAWDNSAEAVRAVRAATPLLSRASEIVILQAPGGVARDRREGAAPDRLQAYLDDCGLTRVRVETVDGLGEGERLIEATERLEARVLVAGAFDHSRAREALFGGATRAFLNAAPALHLLLSH